MPIKGKTKGGLVCDKLSDIPRVLAPALYVLNKLDNRLNKHKLFKILYFADREYIAKYGRPFTDEPSYIAMANGPVPSKLYDYVKLAEGKFSFPIDRAFEQEVANYISTEVPYWVISKRAPNEEFLSRSAIKTLEESISRYKDKSFGALTDLSHDTAWKAASQGTEMDLIEIAKVGGANADMISYIKETM